MSRLIFCHQTFAITVMIKRHQHATDMQAKKIICTLLIRKERCQLSEVCHEEYIGISILVGPEWRGSSLELRWSDDVKLENEFFCLAEPVLQIRRLSQFFPEGINFI
ncbi:hypothetical protein F0562_006405 [Nyssa sinensis]|uniref:Uncharacterized protein n=1 Tax=Nyssa sinensis TaxID=561372 RepID=A0A5J5AR72_9ASTE|nr:hypothetical protein F0562_006405 [Nyssa sinensis]